MLSGFVLNFWVSRLFLKLNGLVRSVGLNFMISMSMVRIVEVMLSGMLIVSRSISLSSKIREIVLIFISFVLDELIGFCCGLCFVC